MVVYWVEQRWLIRFKSGDEQAVFASQELEDAQRLIFLNADGSLAADFDLCEVASSPGDKDSVS